METSITTANLSIMESRNHENNRKEWRFGKGFRQYKNVNSRVKGEFPFYTDLVVGGYVSDIFELTDSDIRRSILVDMLEPIRISMKAVKSRNTKRITFEIGITEISDPDEISVLSLPRNKMENVGVWIERELGDYQGVNQPVKEYVAQAFETLAPILEKRALAVYEKDSIAEVYARIVEDVTCRAETRAGMKDPQYQINCIDGQGDFVCIKGKTAFQNLLTAIGAEYNTLDLLKKFEAMGLLLVNSGRHYDFRFDGGWWYVIRIDRNMIKKGEVTGYYE